MTSFGPEVALTSPPALPDAEVGRRREVSWPLLAGFVVFLYSVQVLAIGLSFFEFEINGRTAAGSVLIAALLGAVVGRSLLPGLTPQYSDTRWRWLAQPFAVTYGFVAIVLYLLLWRVAYDLPDLSWDGNAYHLPTIALWNQRGFIHWIQTGYYAENLLNGYPKAAEVAAYVLVKALARPELGNALNLVFLPLGCIACVELARRMGASAAMSWVAGAAFVFIPVNVNQAATTYVDSAFGSAAIAFFAIVLHCAEHRRPSWMETVVLGASAALVVGIKGSGLATIGAGFGAIVVDALVRGGVTPRERMLAATRKVARCLVPALLVAGAGFYWYARNYWYTGTPLYPAGIKLLGYQLFPGLPVAEILFEAGNTPPGLRELPPILRPLHAWLQGLARWPATIGGVDSREGGLGFLWLIGGVPAIAALVVRPPRRGSAERLRAVLLVTVVGAAFVATPMNWWARYTVWIVGLGLAAWALAASSLLRIRGMLPACIAALWLTAGAVISIWEGGLCLISWLDYGCPGTSYREAASVMLNGCRNRPSSYLLQGDEPDVLGELTRGQKRVVVGPVNSGDAWNLARLVGWLSEPLGAHELVLLKDGGASLREAIANGAQVVIWDGALAVPEALNDWRRETAGRYIAFFR